MYRSLPNKYIGWLLLSVLINTPVAAHTLKVTKDVGGVLHIEPHDNPRAGKAAQAWIVLTRKGGQIIPLAQCNCQLTVYRKPRRQGDVPLLQPKLQALSNQQYQGIPGTKIVFPNPGEYELELRGTPKAGANFQPFKLLYTVNVSS